MSRKLLIKFKSLTEPVHVKKIVLPVYNPLIPDLVVLKELLFKEMLADKSIFSLGGNLNTRVEDILIMKFDEDFQIVVDVDSSEIFLDLERNVLVKLEQTEASDADSIISITAVDEEVKVGSLKRKNNENDDCSSETTNESPEGSTDFVYSSSDSNNAQDLYNKKPRCMEKISSKATVAERSQILDSRINGGDVEKQPKHHSLLIRKPNHSVSGDDGADFVLKAPVENQDYAGIQLINLTAHFPSDGDNIDLVPKAVVNQQLEHRNQHLPQLPNAGDNGDLVPNAVVNQQLEHRNQHLPQLPNAGNCDYLLNTGDNGDLVPNAVVNQQLEHRNQHLPQLPNAAGDNGDLVPNAVVNQQLEHRNQHLPQLPNAGVNGDLVPKAVVEANQQPEHQPTLPNAEVCCDLSNCTLPEEGYEEWEINPCLAALIKQNRLTLNVNQFFLVCARHLMRIFPLGRSKGLYRLYAQMIVQKYDCLKDRNSLIPYETVKAKFLACIRNQSHYGTSKSSRISKRLLQVQTTSEEGSSSTTTDEVAAGTSSESVGPAATTTGEKDRDFKRRRSIVNGNKNQTTVEILKNIPFYENFPNVYADFMMMEPMSTITEEIFKQNFELLVQNLRRYLFQHTGKKYGEEENGKMEVLLAINALCSAKQGAKSSTPVFKSAKRGESSTVDYSGVNTSATVFFEADEDNTIHSILIVCGTAINYKNIKAKSMCETVLSLLSVYYAFDRNYPALYGVLLLVERYCLCRIGAARQGSKTGDKTTWKNFVRSFQLFLTAK